MIMIKNKNNSDNHINHNNNHKHKIKTKKNKKQQCFFPNYKSMHIYVKSVKNIQVIRFQKKINLNFKK